MPLVLPQPPPGRRGGGEELPRLVGQVPAASKPGAKPGVPAAPAGAGAAAGDGGRDHVVVVDDQVAGVDEWWSGRHLVSLVRPAGAGVAGAGGASRAAVVARRVPGSPGRGPRAASRPRVSGRCAAIAAAAAGGYPTRPSTDLHTVPPADPEVPVDGGGAGDAPPEGPGRSSRRRSGPDTRRAARVGPGRLVRISVPVTRSSSIRAAACPAMALSSRRGSARSAASSGPTPVTGAPLDQARTSSSGSAGGGEVHVVAEHREPVAGRQAQRGPQARRQGGHVADPAQDRQVERGQQRVHHVRKGAVDEPGPGTHPGHRPGQPHGEGGLQRKGDPESGLGDQAGPGRGRGHPLVRGLRRCAADQHVGPEPVQRLDLVGQRLGGERDLVAADRGPGPAGAGELGDRGTVAGQQGDRDGHVGSAARVERRERRQRVAEGAGEGATADDRDVPRRHRTSTGTARERSRSSARIVT